MHPLDFFSSHVRGCSPRRTVHHVWRHSASGRDSFPLSNSNSFDKFVVEQNAVQKQRANISKPLRASELNRPPCLDTSALEYLERLQTNHRGIPNAVVQVSRLRLPSSRLLGCVSPARMSSASISAEGRSSKGLVLRKDRPSCQFETPSGCRWTPHQSYEFEAFRAHFYSGPSKDADEADRPILPISEWGT